VVSKLNKYSFVNGCRKITYVHTRYNAQPRIFTWAIQQPGDKSEKIMIGSNVWIGRGSIILPGSVIEDGVIIGAHSVVKGHLKANCM